jgi:hypothetical protein
METTVAMDFAVDDTVELPSGYVPARSTTMTSGAGHVRTAATPS